jgi:hypothetical protein
VTARLHVDAELRLRHDGDTFAVWSEDDRLVVNAPSLSALRQARPLLEHVPPGALTGDRLPDEPPPVELRVRHAPVARTGPDVSPTPGTRRLVGLAAAVDPRGVLAAAIRALG